jgi:hypothetical protein
MVLAIINAILRNEVYKPIIGDLRAHQLSTIIFMALILIVTYLVLRFFNLKLSIQQSILIGKTIKRNHVPTVIIINF